MSAPGLLCPFCDSPETELVSAWGGQMITSQVRCRGCNSYFEAVREDFAGHPAAGHPAAGHPAAGHPAAGPDATASTYAPPPGGSGRRGRSGPGA